MVEKFVKVKQIIDERERRSSFKRKSREKSVSKCVGEWENLYERRLEKRSRDEKQRYWEK